MAKTCQKWQLLGESVVFLFEIVKFSEHLPFQRKNVLLFTSLYTRVTLTSHSTLFPMLSYTYVDFLPALFSTPEAKAKGI